jgi:sugar phosphate isomerase/epimerase
MPQASFSPDAPLSLAHLSEIDVPPLELVAAAARGGFSSVGLRTAPAVLGGVAYPLRTASEQAALRRLIAETGVSVLYIELISLGAATRADDHKPMLDVGAAIGATRLAVAGDSSDFALVADRMAAICDLAAPLGIAVDLEFMPYRGVATLADAVEVVRRAGRPNAHVLLDALHFFRSTSSLALLAGLDPTLIGTFQICDAPRAAPPHAELVVEARTRRLLPGQGELPLWPLIDALPAAVPLGVEVPLYSQRSDLDPASRLAMLVAATRQFLAQRSPP